MRFTVHGGEDLGVANCDYVAEGDTADTVAQDMITHLEDEHDIKMPDVEYVTSGDPIEVSDSATQVIVKRLRTALDIEGTVTPGEEIHSDTVVPPGDMPGNL